MNLLPPSELPLYSITLTSIAFFGFGLLLGFASCAFSVTPGVTIGQEGGVSRQHNFRSSLVYMLAMTMAYTFVGVIAGLLGGYLRVAFQSSWVIGSFGVIFVLLGLSMFGFYELQAPKFLRSKLTEANNRQRGACAGVFVKGVLSAFVVGPGVAAPLVGVLIYVALVGSAIKGGLALLSLGLGMSVSLAVVGTSSDKVLPYVESWIDAIKAVLGVILLASAIWVLERILPAAVAIFLWATLLIVSAVYLGALEHSSSGGSRLRKGVGVLMLTYGALLLIGVSAGRTDMLQPFW